MQIDNNVYVAIDYRLTLASGEEVDSSPEGRPFGFITGTGQVIPGLENQLMGKTTGNQEKIVVDPEEGYGPVNENLLQEIPKDQFPADCEVEPGMTFQAQGPQGPVMLRIKEVKDDGKVVVDLNHPLAGEQLHFDVKVVEVREPSAEELAQLEQQAAGCGCGCGTDEQSNCGSGCGC
ncbi:MAG TPA: peptidylprolyl isomerase [Desulfobacteraceae bacterium]|nr:peptidylprolyl isomerase [Desulfobacteraceae bacterium]